MSSTNRGGKREVSDYYRTPIEDIMSFLRVFDLQTHLLGTLQGADILDPCAGGDPVRPEMSYPKALELVANITGVTTMDIRVDSGATLKQDYLLTPVTQKPRLIITNPPFVLAQPIIEKALTEATEWVVMLLRLNFFEGAKRRAFWRNNMPTLAWVHHKRLSFTSDNKTDSIAYRHCCWKVGTSPAFVELRLL